MEDQVTIDSLSYKELQSLAMSLNLPGKMKSGVLVEAIKARQNQNEQAVAAILEANRQRRNMRRQQQLEHQQMLLKITNDPKRTCVSTRSRHKRSAAEMSTESSSTTTNPLVIDEGVKRSRLEVILKLPQHTYPSRRSTALRKTESTTWDFCRNTLGGSSTTAPSTSACTVPTAQSLLPEPKEQRQNMSVMLPVASHDSISSSASSAWSMDQQHPPSVGQQSVSFDDSGCWMPGPSDETAFGDYNSSPWKNSSRFHQISANGNGSSYEVFDTPPQLPSSQLAISSSNLFEEDIFGVAPYRPEELLNSVVVQQPFPSNSASEMNYNYDYELESNPSPNNPSYRPMMSSLICAFDYAFYGPEFCPGFRVQRPGNSSPIFVHSGRGMILPSFSLTLPRVASYVQ